MQAHYIESVSLQVIVTRWYADRGRKFDSFTQIF
jgi:hypothetical protein